MCGIAGKVVFGEKQINPELLQHISKIIAHRGPDDEGVYLSSDRKVGLINRRLAINDLSSKGHMPMGFKNKFIVTFNGEIYNFGIIRKELEKSGYTFNTGTDTEVILALYDKYGFDCLRFLRGMFAFALYDRKKNILFLARDRMGKKPLKYYWKNGNFIFASELKAILADPSVKKDPDWKAIYDYLTFGYVLPPQTGFVDIQKLPPAHYLILDISKGILIKQRYWKLDITNKLDISEKEWVEKIIKTLRTATKLRMIADVPIGAFLSGGVDSSAVVALMAQESKRPVKTFTIGFPDKKYSEIDHARRIADMYHTDHTEIIVNPESVELLPELAKQYEEPFADASSVVTFLVSKLARNYVKVVLNGDGGDENFAGYDRYDRINRDVQLDRYEPLIRPWAIPTTRFGMKKSSSLAKINRFLEKSKLPLSKRLETYIQIFGSENKKKLYQKNIKTDSTDLINKAFLESEAIDLRDQVLYWDLTRYLPEDLLVKVDIASMSVGLEARSPMLDQEFVELAASIPFNLKLKKGVHKYILKKALEGIVPNENIYRKKFGFSIPLSEWFTGKLNKYTQSILLSKTAFTKDVFNQKEIARMLKEHEPNNDFGPRLWSLLVLELWLKAYFN